MKPTAPLSPDSRTVNDRRRHLRTGSGVLVLLASMLPSATTAAHAQRARVLTPAMDPASRSAAALGPELAGSQPLEITLRLGPTPEQEAALQSLLLAQTQSGSPQYHQWLKPSQFQQQFGWSTEERQALTTWLQNQGFAENERASSASRLVLRASAAQAEATFGTTLQQAALPSGNSVFLNSAEATLPVAFARHLTGISGLDTLPRALAGRLIAPHSELFAAATPQAKSEAAPANSAPAAAPETTETTDQLLRTLEDAVTANTSPVLTLASTLCPAQTTSADRAAFRAALQQAQAQGITVLVSGTCAAATTDDSDSTAQAVFPSALSEVAAVLTSTAKSTLTSANTAEARPAWQIAAGLPADQLRQAPDFAVTSTEALQNAVLELNTQTGNRLGNLSPTLYTLANSPGLFTQPESADNSDNSDASQWTTRAGLGVLDTKALLRVYPRALISTSVSLVSSSYNVHYGENATLTATVSPATYGTANPTGTVVFTASGQGILGSVQLGSGGTAALTVGSLPAGTYTITATYSGDGLYASSTNPSPVGLYVAMVTANLSAVLSPLSKIPYGATATVTATVALPYANATPSGTVTAQLQGVTGASYTATLSPNSGGNTATGNINVSVPPPGTYNLQVTCQGNTNYQCQTPVNLTLATIRGYSSTTISAAPQAPQAGQSVALTATLANAGNGTGSYTFGGSVSFFDSGKLIATVPVATNQATTTTMLSGNRVHNITATYTGDANWNTSTSDAVAVSPTILPDTLSISSNVSNGTSLSGVNIIFTSTAASSITYGAGPTGTVTFYDTFNGTVVAIGNPATLVPNGSAAAVAIFNTTGLRPGVHSIYAQYSGDSYYASAISSVISITIADFGLTMTPPTLTVDQGKSQQVSVLVNGTGYTGSVSLGCTPPASSEATCSFSPASVSAGGATTLTIVTTAPAVASNREPSLPSRLFPAASGISLAALVLVLLPRRSRRLPTLLALLLVSSAALSSLGCGLGIRTINGGSGNTSDLGTNPTGSTGSTTDPGSPLGTSNFTITAAGVDANGNTVRHTYQYQVTIQ